MAELANYTEDESQKLSRELSCLPEFTGDVHNELIFLSALNIFLSITAFLGNTLILVALSKESSLHPPSKALYRNLAITDLCVGVIAEPLYAGYFISVVTKRWDVCYYMQIPSFATNYMLCSVSLCTMTTISMDRLLALLLGLKYRQVVTLRRTWITVIIFWILCFVGASASFWNPRINSWWLRVTLLLCLVISILSYTIIFFTLRRKQMHVPGHVTREQQNQTIPQNIARFRRAVYSALWVQITLVVCYLPFGIAAALTPQRGVSLSVYRARNFTGTIVLLNSSLNPLLYCWKIAEVRQAVKYALFCASH